jgi:hypothetical protein
MEGGEIMHEAVAKEIVLALIENNYLYKGGDNEETAKEIVKVINILREETK